MSDNDVNNDWLYYLYFEEEGAESIFYAGVAKDPYVRFQKHLTDSSDTKKAKFIRHLQSLSIPIRHRKVRQCTSPDDEYFFINELEQQGCILTNSVSGNYNRHVNETKPKLSNLTPDQLSGKWEPCFLARDWACRAIMNVRIMRKTQPRGKVYKVSLNQTPPVTIIFPHSTSTKDIRQSLCDTINPQLQ